MSEYTYKTKDGVKTGFIPGVGAIVDGIITSQTVIENANLELVLDNVARPEPLIATASQQNPNQPETAEGSINTGAQE